MTKTSQTSTKVVHSKEFQEGVKAFQRGDAEDSCPYPAQSNGSSKRSDWYIGYLETRGLRSYKVMALPIVTLTKNYITSNGKLIPTGTFLPYLGNVVGGDKRCRLNDGSFVNIPAEYFEETKPPCSN